MPDYLRHSVFAIQTVKLTLKLTPSRRALLIHTFKDIEFRSFESHHFSKALNCRLKIRY